MKSILVALGILLASFLPATPSRAADAPRPNIIFILADDLGIGNVSCYGADQFKTPNIDALAKRGTRFTRCYAAPLCGPSRALIMTGRYAFRTGMTGNDTGALVKPENEIMAPTVLKKAGYVTAQVGKWSQLPLEPGDWGFDEYLRIKGSGTYWNTQDRGKTYTRNGKAVSLKDDEYLPDLMHDFAVDFITRHQKEPFYLYYPMSHVHGEILRTPDSAPDSKDFYADNINYMDKLVGKLMAKLDELKLRDNTLVIFVGDNGTAAPAAARSTVAGKSLSGHKGMMLECGSLVPMIAAWPGHTPAGKVSDSLMDFSDYLPTLADLTGAALPDKVTIDGKSFASELMGKSAHARDWIFVELGRHWYARSDKYKLTESGQLFDVTATPFEEKAVAADAPAAADADAARKQLQAVLDTLSPASGKVAPGDASGKGAKRGAKAATPDRAALWDTLDQEKSGKLTLEQFTARRPNLPNPTRRFNNLDTNHDGTLTRDEFVKDDAPAAPAAK
jgi:arylsulfatase A